LRGQWRKPCRFESGHPHQVLPRGPIQALLTPIGVPVLVE